MPIAPGSPDCPCPFGSPPDLELIARGQVDQQVGIPKKASLREAPIGTIKRLESRLLGYSRTQGNWDRKRRRRPTVAG